MKRFVFTISVLMMVSPIFASSLPSTNNADPLSSLGLAFRAEQPQKLDQNDITIVYGGEDLSTRDVLQNPTVIA